MPLLLSRRAVSVCVALALLSSTLVGLAVGQQPGTGSASTAVAAAEVGRAPLPPGSDQRGLPGVERTALDLAAALDAVPVRGGGDESTRYCAREDLRVRWTAPLPGEFAVGGHIDPVGPAPTPSSEEVNGLVVCAGASYAYMGFEARWNGGAWSLAAVPALSDEHDLEPQAHDGAGHDRAAPRAPAPPAAQSSLGFRVPAVDGIDPYPAYDPQRVCDPVAKPGTAALRDLLLRTYPGSRNLGVSRTCTARGTSEHKEGRAFDWGVDKGVATERAAAESLLTRLLATDSAGHQHALARRLGVMYLIWDRQIWSAYAARRGWRPYSGASAHTDHVHISLSWDGAMGRTSYWSGANATLLRADPALQLAPGSAPVGGSAIPSGAGGTAPSTRGTRAVVAASPTPPVQPSPVPRLVRESAAREQRAGRREKLRREHRRGPYVVQPSATQTSVEQRPPASPRSSGGRPGRAEPAEVARPRAARVKPQRPQVERVKPQRPQVQRVKPQRPHVQRVKPQRPQVQRVKPRGPQAERSEPQRGKSKTRR